MPRPLRSTPGSRARMAEILSSATRIRQSRVDEPRLRRCRRRAGRSGPGTGGRGGGRRLHAKSSSPRAPPRPTIWRFSGSRTTTASAAATSSPRGPSTRRCSIPAVNWSGAAGRFPTWFRIKKVCWIPIKSPPRCGRTRCWCRSCTSTMRSAWCKTSPQSARSVRGMAARGCMSMRRKALENARCILPASVRISCRSRRTRPTDRKGWALWWFRSVASRAAGAGCNSPPCNSAAVRSGPCGRGPWRPTKLAGMGLAFELAAKFSSVETARIARLQQRLWQRAGLDRRRVAQRQRLALGAAFAQCVVRRRRRREPAGGDSPACGRVDRIGVHLGAGRALVRAARLGAQRSLERKQPAIWLGKQHHGGGHRYRGGRIDARGWPASEDVRRAAGLMNYNELTRRYFESAEGVGELQGPGFFGAPPGTRARHLGAIRSASRSGSDRGGEIFGVCLPAYHRGSGVAGGPGARNSRCARGFPRTCRHCASDLRCRSRKLGRLLIVEDAWHSAVRRAIDYRQCPPTSVKED